MSEAKHCGLRVLNNAQWSTHPTLEDVVKQLHGILLRDEVRKGVGWLFHHGYVERMSEPYRGRIVLTEHASLHFIERDRAAVCEALSAVL